MIGTLITMATDLVAPYLVGELATAVVRSRFGFGRKKHPPTAAHQPAVTSGEAAADHSSAAASESGDDPVRQRTIERLLRSHARTKNKADRAELEEELFALGWKE